MVPLTVIGRERLAAATGIVFVAFFVAGGFLVGGAGGDTSDSAAEVSRRLLDRDAQVYAGATLLGLAAAALLWFAGSLRVALRRAEGDPGRLSAVAFGAAAVLAALVLIGAVLSGASVFELADYQGDAEAARALYGVSGAVTFFGAALSLGVLLVSASLVSLRTRAFPRWLMSPGIVIGALLTLGWFFWPVTFLGNMLAGVWIIVTSIILMARAGRTAEP